MYMELKSWHEDQVLVLFNKCKQRVIIVPKKEKLPVRTRWSLVLLIQNFCRLHLLHLQWKEDRLGRCYVWCSYWERSARWFWNCKSYSTSELYGILVASSDHPNPRNIKVTVMNPRPIYLVKIQLHVFPHSFFQREGNDLFMDMEITLKQVSKSYNFHYFIETLTLVFCRPCLDFLPIFYI